MIVEDLYDISDLIIKLALIWENPKDNPELIDLIARLIKIEVEDIQSSMEGRAF